MAQFVEQYSNKQKSLIIGCILGDGYLSKHEEKRRNSQLAILNSCEQTEWLEYKHKVLSQLFNTSKIYKTENTKYCRKQFYCNDIIFNYLKPKIYPNNQKKVRRKFLNWLDEEGLAWWFMDDGSCCKRFINKKPKGRFLRINTQSFTYEEHKKIKKYFKNKWGIKIKITRTTKKEKEYFMVTFNVESAIKFINLIKPYIIPEMEYKIAFDYESVFNLPDKNDITVCSKKYYNQGATLTVGDTV